MNAEYKKWKHDEHDDGEPLFDVYINGILAAVAKTNEQAAHIVRCVNSHDALVDSVNCFAKFGQKLSNFLYDYDLLDWDMDESENKIVADFKAALSEAVDLVQVLNEVQS